MEFPPTPAARGNFRSFAVTLNVHAYTLRPSFRAALLGFLVHHNPFYLLSALSMLAGCYALNSGLAARTGDLPKLLALLGVLNAYEGILIGLGLYLIRRRGIVRDGRTLLLLQAAFLVDLAFLDAEVGSVSLRTGCLLGLLVLALALIKAGAVVRGLWGRVPRRWFAFVALQLGVLFLLPSVFTQFRQHQNGNVTAGQFYGAWWVVGGLMILYELQARFLRQDAAFDTGLRLFIRRLGSGEWSRSAGSPTARRSSGAWPRWGRPSHSWRSGRGSVCGRSRSRSRFRQASNRHASRC